MLQPQIQSRHTSDRSGRVLHDGGYSTLEIQHLQAFPVFLRGLLPTRPRPSSGVDCCTLFILFAGWAPCTRSAFCGHNPAKVGIPLLAPARGHSPYGSPPVSMRKYRETDASKTVKKTCIPSEVFCEHGQRSPLWGLRVQPLTTARVHAFGEIDAKKS